MSWCSRVPPADRALSTDAVLWLHSLAQGDLPSHAKCLL